MDRLQMAGKRIIGLQDGVRLSFVVAVVFALGGAIAFRQSRLKKVHRPQRTRPSAFALVAGQVSLGWVLFAFYFTGGWTLESVGVSSQFSAALAFAAGLAVYVVFSLAVHAAVVVADARLAFMRAALRANSLFFRSNPFRNALVVAVVVLANPVTEELFFRGLLVHQFHMTGAPFWLAVSLGAVSNAINHAYQGRSFVLYHAAFFSLAIGLMYSPLGLVAAIGMHFAADLVPLALYPTQLQKYREMRRHARRSNSGLQQTPSSLTLGRRS